MNGLIPVSVACGMSGSASISSLSALARPLQNCLGSKIFLFKKYNGSFLGDFPIVGACAKKKERNPVKENITTAIQASDSIQKTCQFRSKTPWGGACIADIRTKAALIIMTDKQREAPKTSFWPSLIWIRQSSWMGMAITKRSLRISLQNG